MITVSNVSFNFSGTDLFKDVNKLCIRVTNSAANAYLFSDAYKNIEKWKIEQSIKITKERRPDLYEKYLENKDKDY